MNPRLLIFLAKTLAAIWLVSAIIVNLMMVRIATRSFFDFGSFIAAGSNLRSRANPYSDSSPTVFEIYFPEAQAGGKLPNLNPPITLFIFGMIPNTNTLLVANFWRGISIILYILAILLLVKNIKSTNPLLIVWLLAMAGFWHTVELGQIYVPLLVLLILAWLSSIKGKDLEFGIFLGLLASIKPNFLIWIFFVGLIRNWKALGWALITFISVSTIPLFVYGPGVFYQWWDASQVGISILSMPGNSSLIGLTSRFGLPAIGRALSIILLIALVVSTCRKAALFPLEKGKIANEIGIITSLLASPITWVGYTIFLVPIFFVKNWSRWMVMAASIFSVPFIYILALYNTSRQASEFWGWFYGWGLAILLIDVMTKKPVNI